jgi:hypothetical protein
VPLAEKIGTQRYIRQLESRYPGSHHSKHFHLLDLGAGGTLPHSIIIHLRRQKNFQMRPEIGPTPLTNGIRAPPSGSIPKWACFLITAPLIRTSHFSALYNFFSTRGGRAAIPGHSVILRNEKILSEHVFPDSLSGLFKR